MMRLSEIHRVARMVDDRRCSAFADRLAEPWGLPPEACRFRRSSASHVFATLDGRFLKAVPAGWCARTRVDAVAAFVDGLRCDRVRVAAFVPSQRGHVVETVATEWGDYHVRLTEGAPGKEIDVAELTDDQAMAWGAALAAVHTGGPASIPDLPMAFDRLRDALFVDDPALAAAVAELAELVAAQPVDPAVFGLVHGDFELDNLAWTDDGPTAYDFDEAARSWFADDIAKATIDLRPESDRLLDRFLAGYRTVRPFEDHQLASVPLFAAARAADTLINLRESTDDGLSYDDPAWLRRLRIKIENHIARQRDIVLAYRAGD